MKKTTALVLLFIFTTIVNAQRFDILSGKLENLKEISEYNVVFDYSDLEVNGFDSEQAYLKEKIEKRQHYDSKKAEKFEESWYSDRKNKYEPKFIYYFNEQLQKEKVVVSRNTEAKYSMNVKTTWVYPGYELAKVEPAKISAIITIVETANPSKILVAIQFDKVIGIVKNYRQQGDRISGAYEKLAKKFAMQLKRFL